MDARLGEGIRVRIAVVGSGISGLATAWLLSRRHEVDVLEANDYLGGHAHTVDIDVRGSSLAVDTGFMVCNRRTYPNLMRLFEHLGIDLLPSDMSFSVHCDEPELEWCGRNLNTVFAQRGNVWRGRFWHMLYDILRLDRSATRLVADGGTADLTLGQLLQRERFGEPFREWYLVPMGAAIWSTQPPRMLDFPASTFLRFCHNHGLLRVSGKPKWLSVAGGARRYVTRLVEGISGQVLAGQPVVGIARTGDGIDLWTKVGERPWRYDGAVLACHADDALHLLRDPGKAERTILGAFPYSHNDTVLHTDESFLPVRRRAHAAWNYWSESSRAGTKLSVTYYLNRLQSLSCDSPVLVTLNPCRQPDPDRVLARFDYAHPTFVRRSIEAQKEIDRIQGVGSTWYAGAWQRYGFHEDGLLSALRVAKAFGINPPWGEVVEA